MESLKEVLLDWTMSNAATAALRLATKKWRYTKCTVDFNMRHCRHPADAGAAKWGGGRLSSTSARSRSPVDRTEIRQSTCEGQCPKTRRARVDALRGN